MINIVDVIEWTTNVVALATGEVVTQARLATMMQGAANRTAYLKSILDPINSRWPSLLTQVDDATSSINGLLKSTHPFVVHAAFAGGTYTYTYDNKPASVTMSTTGATGLYDHTFAGTTLRWAMATTGQNGILVRGAYAAGAARVSIINASNANADGNYDLLVWHEMP